jgi:glycosyltransferase involved in cell wall biosynthesis
MGTAAGRLRGLGSFLLRAPNAIKKMEALLLRMKEAHGCDVVLCQYPREQFLTAKLGSKVHYRSVWMIHSRFYYLVHQQILNPMLRRAMLHADTVFVFSESTRQALANDGFPESRMTVLPEAIDVPRTLPPRQAKNKAKVGVVSRLHYSKGVQDVLSAAALLLRVLPDVEFLIAGDGPYRPTLERLTRKLGIEDSVQFLGFMRDPWRIMSQIDVLAHATFDLGDSMPLALLEAGAAGIPVVATRWSGIPEIVQDGKTGLLVPPHDAPAMAEGIAKLLRDPTLALSCGSLARNWVTDHFHISVAAQRFVDQVGRQKVHS